MCYITHDYDSSLTTNAKQVISKKGAEVISGGYANLGGAERLHSPLREKNLTTTAHTSECEL